MKKPKVREVREVVAALSLSRAAYNASSDKAFTINDFALYVHDTDRRLFARCVVLDTHERLTSDLPTPVEDVYDDELDMVQVVSLITRRLPAED